VEPTVTALRAQLEPFLSELAQLHYRHGAGISPTLPLAELYRSYPGLSRPESFAMVEEALGRGRADEEEKRRLRALRELVATQVEEAQARTASEDIARLEAEGEVVVPSGNVTFREAWAALPAERNRAVRSATERALGAFLLTHSGAWARRREAAFDTARALGHAGYLPLRTHVTGIALQPLANAARAVLRRTEDAYRDVLAYALKKLEPELRPLPHGDAARHDLLRLALAPWLAEHFRREDLLPAVRRSVEEMGFHPSAHGRIQQDTEERPNKSARPFVAQVRVPDDLRLVVRPGQGMEDCLSLLHEYGHALHLSHLPRHAPVEDRRLSDPSVTEAYAFAFGHFLLEDKWHRRYLGMSAPLAKEAARLAAFNELALLRRHAARLLHELELYRRGASLALSGDYQSLMEGALFVRVPEGLFLHDVDPQLYGVRYLRGWALEVLLSGQMRERFDDDYFRNPASARWLTGLFDLGSREDADGVARLVGPAPLSLEAAGARLVAVLDR
jgi:hypothetical protein